VLGLRPTGDSRSGRFPYRRFFPSCDELRGPAQFIRFWLGRHARTAVSIEADASAVHPEAVSEPAHDATLAASVLFHL
jgi:hypothetical protein